MKWRTETFDSFAASALDVSGGPESCWPFIGVRTDHGYGTFKRHGVRYRAHRVAYELAYGTLPPDTSVCHSCDNPPCCNPLHLWLGVQRENMADMAQKGRVGNNPLRGTESAQAKLTDDDVRAIRREYVPQKPGPRGANAVGLGRRDLARKYGVSRSLIDHVLARTAWAHVD